eukprot:GGOE01006441.1.p1 GENE.GGOE01006441.1~~GGOE01006441.1.p1  ORF type:complete len:437 (-),score=97.15 GGOE01006441.1:406-1539(-)
MTNKRQGLMAEFAALGDLEAALDRDPTLWRTAKLPCNRNRNRYVDVLANEPTRVQLQPPAGGSDYINANHVDGAPWQLPQSYIVAQAPSAETVEHWWAMIYRAKVSLVVMLSNVVEQGHIKGHAYWPKAVGAKTAAKFGALSVTLEEETPVAGCPDLLFRRLLAQPTRAGEGTARQVVMYQFTGWPDHGIPKFTYQLVHLLRLMDAPTPALDGPILIHCSAGVGRSGVLLTSHIIWSQLRLHLLAHGGNHSEFAFSVVRTVAQLRRCRNHIVQTPEQLAFTYMLLLHASEKLLTNAANPPASAAVTATLPSTTQDSGATSPATPPPASLMSAPSAPSPPPPVGSPSGRQSSPLLPVRRQPLALSPAPAVDAKQSIEA